MEVREIRVEFKKTVSDGNYGNETYSVAFTATLAPGEEGESQLAHDLAGQAYEVVLWKLKRSASEGVRLALETHEEREARWAKEQDELRARRAAAQDDAPIRLTEEQARRLGAEPVKDEDSPF